MSSKQIDIIIDGVLYYFGISENPAEKQAKKMLEKTPGEKIREDIARVNKSLKHSYSKVRQKALSSEQ